MLDREDLDSMNRFIDTVEDPIDAAGDFTGTPGSIPFVGGADEGEACQGLDGVEDVQPQVIGCRSVEPGDVEYRILEIPQRPFRPVYFEVHAADLLFTSS